MFPHKFVKFIKFLNQVLHWQLYGNCPDLDNLSIIDSVFFKSTKGMLYLFLPEFFVLSSAFKMPSMASMDSFGYAHA